MGKPAAADIISAMENRRFIVREAQVDEIVNLRHVVLRAGLPIETSYFERDSFPGSFHAGAFDQTNFCVGCATLHLIPFESKPALKLRGMAVAEGWRKSGVGTALLKFIENHAAEKLIRVLWCEGRTPAVPFYKKNGWQAVGEEYFVPTAGPHFKMFKEI